jgi:hypothetical protein
MTCHRVYPDGWIDPKPAKKRKTIIREMLSGWCNETAKPVSKRICNLGECERGAVWKPSPWQPVSTILRNTIIYLIPLEIIIITK